MLRIMITIAAATLLSVPLNAEDLRVEGDRLLVPVDVGGTRIEALLDSGAEVTVFDRATADQIGIGRGKEVEARGTGAGSVAAELVQDVSVTVLGRDIAIPTAAVIDLSDVGARLLGRPMPMVLGREFFDAGRVLIDIDRARLEWLPDSAMPTGERIPLSTEHGIETFPVRFGRSDTVNVDFDLGNGTGLLVSEALARKLNLAPVGVEPGGGIGGAAPRTVVYVPELSIAGRSFCHVRAHVVPGLQVAGNVGVGLLRQFVMVTDFPGRAVWLDPVSPQSPAHSCKASG